jgi:hypothetical protein
MRNAEVFNVKADATCSNLCALKGKLRNCGASESRYAKEGNCCVPAGSSVRFKQLSILGNALHNYNS